MFRTPISIPTSPVKIDHSTAIFTIGSCFSDCMGQRFQENKFDVLANPFGTVYNPISIAKLLSYTIKNQVPPPDSYTTTHGLHANFDFHSSFSSTERSAVEKRIKEAIEQAHGFLQKAKWLIITLGTAFVYERTDNNTIVSNCHKLPAGMFNKRLLTQKQILAELTPAIDELSSISPGLNIIFTVSPVRHIKDTLIHNSVSKATLRITCETLANSHEQLQYFPSYEIMMDDLRDYRFYKSDMIHPNDEAEQYIWDKFSSSYFTSGTLEILKAWVKIKTAINHKPFNPSSDKHQHFIRQTIKQLKQLESKINITDELAHLEGQLVL